MYPGEFPLAGARDPAGPLGARAAAARRRGRPGAGQAALEPAAGCAMGAAGGAEADGPKADSSAMM